MEVDCETQAHSVPAPSAIGAVPVGTTTVATPNDVPHVSSVSNVPSVSNVSNSGCNKKRKRSDEGSPGCGESLGTSAKRLRHVGPVMGMPTLEEVSQRFDDWKDAVEDLQRLIDIVSRHRMQVALEQERRQYSSESHAQLVARAKLRESWRAVPSREDESKCYGCTALGEAKINTFYRLPGCMPWFRVCEICFDSNPSFGRVVKQLTICDLRARDRGPRVPLTRPSSSA